MLNYGGYRSTHPTPPSSHRLPSQIPPPTNHPGVHCTSSKRSRKSRQFTCQNSSADVTSGGVELDENVAVLLKHPGVRPHYDAPSNDTSNMWARPRSRLANRDLMAE